MRLIKKSIERDMSGSVTLYPEEPEDMWHAFNLIRPNDTVRAPAVRRITTESRTGSTNSQRVHTTLTISVRKIDFDAQGGQLHINGQVTEENKVVSVGMFHTLDLELHRNFTLIKSEWDSVTLGVVKEACNAGDRAEIGAVVLQEGFANVCFITEYMTILRQRIEVPVPRKRVGSTTGYEKAVYQSIIRHFDFSALKVILLASPGFVADGLKDYIFLTALQSDYKPILHSKKKFVTVHCSTGHIHSLNEVLKSPEVSATLADTKFAKETKAMEAFFEMMVKDEFRAWYGPKEVERAVDKGAVGTLLVSNSLFRSNNVSERRKYVRMVEDVKKSGGTSLVLSSIHESGIRLDGLGGIAAILTFPLHDLDESDEEEGEEGEGEKGKSAEKVVA
ncbi:unnamed protein product [Tuber melanosporum]|uniref:Protein DOM34 homolog n=1 Tax=Tuber melanosporum (strain Mel28) TaxID=656061 RepID=D5GG55_TUBMM|nr:uncharacterized protein GSTUM_00007203001 [Tuber melanosporum]CAZ83498.1 unnamed protein product [Tuber melanosporum]